MTSLTEGFMSIEQRERRGFTLVELIVAIGVIVVLLSLLIPTISRAKDQAKSVKCMANLHSIGLALMMYTQQYGYYPAECATWRTEVAIWPTRLRPFLDGNVDVFWCPSRDERYRWDNPANPDKAGPQLLKYGYELNEPLLNALSTSYPGISVGTPFSYGYNGYGATINQFPPEGLGMEADRDERKVSSVKVPSEMIAIGDSGMESIELRLYNGEHFAKSIGYRLPTYDWVGNIHFNGANILYCDGHVTWLPISEVTIPDTAVLSPEMDRKTLYWNCDHLPFSVVRE
jgi:prepilin-type N-terminal cleavage/methylation domain-containing protein/prepilin-type processing-associated H-X9-DG protein